MPSWLRGDSGWRPRS